MSETRPPALEKTVVSTVAGDGAEARPAVRVTIDGAGESEPAVFTSDFRIGRDEDCEVRLDAVQVSRNHAEVAWSRGHWWLRDLDSRNGTHLEGTRIVEAVVEGACRVQLGAEGPRLLVTIAGAGEDGGSLEPTTSYYRRRYLEGTGGTIVGERTMMIRKAYMQVSARRRRWWLGIVALVALVAVGAGGYALHQHRGLERHRALAEQVFYETKEMELRLAELEERVGAGGEETSERLAAGRDQLAGLRGSYQRMIEGLGVYADDVPEEKRLILRIAGVLGECELAVPPEVVAEVERHIELWQADTRLEKAVRRAADNGYGARIAAVMMEQHLPPQLFYVALQESDLRSEVCGPETRYGIAKGAWQFIPGTARAYGLRTGPLYLLRRHDPADDRHDFDLATAAAARYLRDLYTKQAQASGLLVIASYNWGETNVRRLIRQMPENPRERNFWRLFVDHRDRIPAETYGYVFRIFAAAVIGENPELFGFDFENPLASAAPSPEEKP